MEQDENVDSLDGFPNRFSSACLKTGEENSGWKDAKWQACGSARFNQRFLRKNTLLPGFVGRWPLLNAGVQGAT